jgi:uncharacterized protein (DUF2267 family)
MKYKDFLSELRRRGVDHDAERIGAVVLGELTGGLTWQAANLLAAGLPAKVRARVLTRVFGSSMTRFSLDMLTRRVAEAEYIGLDEARAHVTAVLRALDRTLDEHSRERVWSELALVRRELDASATA